MSISRNHDLKRYILPTETVVLATRRHWASLLEPAATTVGSFLAVAVIVFVTPPDLQDVVGWLWFVWLFTLLRFGFRWLEWAHEWFVSTDKRLLLLYGLVIHKVAMMPLVKVTDMGYSRTPLGQLLGYGRFVMESAGQDQALRQIDYVPHPDNTYRTLVGEMFRPPGGTKPTPGAAPEPAGSPSAPGTPTPVPGGPAQVPVVIVPGRGRSDQARPTTQPIAVGGGTAEPLPPTVAPPDAATSTAPPAGTPVHPEVDPWGSAPQVPQWRTPSEWKSPKPYDSHPR